MTNTLLQPQLNPYHQLSFQKQFENTQIYQALLQDFDELLYDREEKWRYSVTPRQQLADPKSLPSIFFVSAFYYLEWLTAANPAEIYDLGCGWNIFKRYIPNIIGVGAEDPSSSNFYGDVHGFVDDSYIAQHQAAFESVFSICALHFIPLSNLRQRVLDFASMIRPGGRGWLAMNAKRMMEFDPLWKNANSNDIDHFVRSQLTNLPFDLLVFDVYLDQINNGSNGNIHLVIKKP